MIVWKFCIYAGTDSEEHFDFRKKALITGPKSAVLLQHYFTVITTRRSGAKQVFSLAKSLIPAQAAVLPEG
mgnify:CR=1 FL=1